MIIICLTIVIVAAIVATSITLIEKDKSKTRIADTIYQSAYKNMFHLNDLITKYINDINEADKNKEFITTNTHKEHFDALLTIVKSSLRY